MTTATATTLSLIRNADLSIEDLARAMQRSDAFAAGAVAAVAGDTSYADARHMNGEPATASERDDYEAGERFAEMLLDDEAGALDAAHGNTAA